MAFHSKKLVHKRGVLSATSLYVFDSLKRINS